MEININIFSWIKIICPSPPAWPTAMQLVRGKLGNFKEIICPSLYLFWRSLNNSNQMAIIVVTSLSEAMIGSVVSILVFMMVIHYWLNVMGNIKILINIISAPNLYWGKLSDEELKWVGIMIKFKLSHGWYKCQVTGLAQLRIFPIDYAVT